MEAESGEADSTQRRVGLLYDDRMCKHQTPDGDHHPENPNRIKAIWNKLELAGVPRRYMCLVLGLSLLVVLISWMLYCLKCTT